MYREHERITLAHDVQAHGLIAGDVGLIVGANGNGGFEVEFTTADGRAAVVLTLAEADIAPVPLRIIEAVHVAPADLTWIRRSDERTAEIPTGQIATTGDLLERLRHVPPDTPLLVDGYESGFTAATLMVSEMQELAGLPDHAGAYQRPADAAAELAGEGKSGWSLTTDPEPPAFVGEPVMAVVLRRS